MSTNVLSELQGCTLGLIWELQPCTIYAVRKVLEGSPSPHWSGSAGAIYPLVRRLKEKGLVQSEEGYTGERRRELYELTDEGLRMLRSWIGPATTTASVGIPVDPLRTRARFLGALDAQQRVEFLENARRELLAQLGEAETLATSIDQADDPFGYLVPRGVVMMSRARLKWIEEAQSLLNPK